MGVDLFPHKSGLGLIEPIALIGHNVCVKYANDAYYRRVIWFEPISPFQCVNLGAIGAATTTARVQANTLQMWRNEFGQFRWYPIDNAQIRLFLPNADGRANLRTVQVPVDPSIVTKDPCGHLTEMFVWEDRNPAFEATNYTAIALTQCRIVAYGYRFITEELPKDKIQQIVTGSLQCTYVVASGFSGKP
jgi:hypothetical protein